MKRTWIAGRISWGHCRPAHTLLRGSFSWDFGCICNTCSRTPRALSATSQHYKNRTKCEKVHYKVLYLTDSNIQDFVDIFKIIFSPCFLFSLTNPRTHSFQIGLCGKDFLVKISIPVLLKQMTNCKIHGLVQLIISIYRTYLVKKQTKK